MIDNLSNWGKPLLAAKPGNAKLQALVLIVDTTGKVWQPAATIGAISAGNRVQLVPNDPSYGFAVTSGDVSDFTVFRAGHFD